MEREPATTRETAAMQIEQLRSQVAELRSRLDQVLPGPEVTAKARETMEEARQRALEMGQRVSEQRGIVIPVGTIMLMLLGIFVAMMFFPQFGERLTETIRRWWNDLTARTR